MDTSCLWVPGFLHLRASAAENKKNAQTRNNEVVVKVTRSRCSKTHYEQRFFFFFSKLRFCSSILPAFIKDCRVQGGRDDALWCSISSPGVAINQHLGIEMPWPDVFFQFRTENCCVMPAGRDQGSTQDPSDQNVSKLSQVTWPWFEKQEPKHARNSTNFSQTCTQTYSKYFKLNFSLSHPSRCSLISPSCTATGAQ